MPVKCPHQDSKTNQCVCVCARLLFLPYNEWLCVCVSSGAEGGEELQTVRVHGPLPADLVLTPGPASGRGGRHPGRPHRLGRQDPRGHPERRRTGQEDAAELPRTRT